MHGRNRKDVEQYEALYRSLYQLQTDLDALTACPQGHLFSNGCITENGRVLTVQMDVNVTPSGRVICNPCAAQRAADWRESLKKSPAEVIEAAKREAHVAAAEYVTTKEDVLAEEDPDAK